MLLFGIQRILVLKNLVLIWFTKIKERGLIHSAYGHWSRFQIMRFLTDPERIAQIKPAYTILSTINNFITT